MTKEEAYQEVLDAIDCNTNGERCLLLERTVVDFGLALLEEVFEKHHPHTCGVWAAFFNDEMRAQINALGEP